jgi:Ca2+-transporting ATPase
LTGDEAARRLTLYGPNELQATTRISPWTILLNQFKNILIIILLIATGLSILLGHGIESIAIIVIVLFAVLLGFIQEYRAERAIEALRQMAAPNATVLRDGREQVVPARTLVPGDIVLLRAGDRVPADLRLIEAVNLQIEEAALTASHFRLRRLPR